MCIRNELNFSSYFNLWLKRHVTKSHGKSIYHLSFDLAKPRHLIFSMQHLSGHSCAERKRHYWLQWVILHLPLLQILRRRRRIWWWIRGWVWVWAGSPEPCWTTRWVRSRASPAHPTPTSRAHRHRPCRVSRHIITPCQSQLQIMPVVLLIKFKTRLLSVFRTMNIW